MEEEPDMSMEEAVKELQARREKASSRNGTTSFPKTKRPQAARASTVQHKGATGQTGIAGQHNPSPSKALPNGMRLCCGCNGKTETSSAEAPR